jgi:DNA-binding MarR family transcriptional regulator
LKVIGLSIPQFDLLSTLTEREGLSQQELAERLYVTKGNVSGLLDRMVEAGLVERRTLPGDRRSNALFLTSKGRDLAERGIAAQRAYVAKTLGTLDSRDLDNLERIVLAWRERARLVEDAGPEPSEA